MRTIIIVTPGPEAWGNFKKLCEAKGWCYQTLSNQKKVPKVGHPIQHDGCDISRIELR